MDVEKERFISPDSLNEEYYQISLEILKSFNRFRPPLSLYLLKEDVASLLPFYSPGQRLDNEKQEKLEEQCKEGNVFVSRKDHSIYAKYISEQLDLILLDKNLKEREIIEILRMAIPKRIGDFFEQPVSAVWERTVEDLLVFTEYLAQDPMRIKGLFRHLFTENDLIKHEYNVGIIGLSLYIRSFSSPKEDIKRKTLDRFAMGLFIHDIGLSKVPQFIRDKSKPLTLEEQEKVQKHTILGANVTRKLGIVYDEVQQCITEHHERIDGSGYPQKKKGDTTSTFGRICAVADSYSAMISERPYSEAMDKKAAAASLFHDNRYDSDITKLLQTILVMD